MPYTKKQLRALIQKERMDLIKQRIALDKANPSGGIEWNELKKKYFSDKKYTPNQTA